MYWSSKSYLDIFKLIFFNEKLYIGIYWHIIWTNDVLFYWRIYVSLDLKVLQLFMQHPIVIEDDQVDYEGIYG